MVDTYFKFKLFSEYYVPLFFFGLATLIFIIRVIVIIIQSHKEDKITKYMKSKGYERKLLRVASVGGGTWYGWFLDNKKVVEEENLFRMSYREVKKKY